jgi:hypothetical protein
MPRFSKPVSATLAASSARARPDPAPSRMNALVDTSRSTVMIWWARRSSRSIMQISCSS